MVAKSCWKPQLAEIQPLPPEASCLDIPSMLYSAYGMASGVNFGPALRFPYSSSVVSSRHAHMRELRVQHAGQPYRILYAFDPLRTAILLIGGDKTGNDRWYDTYVPLADRLYDDHLA
jgi:hypothetical protein